ncbi:hypothetical protein [Clostridium septicum]|uniref:Uncharacterized protein n=1 Tax=Clostridium septicum TaxID=1504 RepID=A0A9N7PM59_CLOSE|nr:hypothetical protein [Clostridium septicum]AYE34682.1 hypothetical protein CP523_09730 [Clostridium septicum]MDU1314353.1 hypothetical protein [Clostridium septicum]QAS60083.1 hypothetical protein EI377_04530 [Clostridium septicum]UEC20674.1 hypothetical protein LK444_15100 [Clostridium septicum]USS01275.1 hypothetical protein NH397_02070 [Clostridium septicum]
MILAVQIFQIIFYSVAILFMIALTIISIWGFIIFNKMHKNQRIQNFLLDKIYQSINHLTYSKYKNSNNDNSKDSFDIDEIINEEELFKDDDNKDNIISF